MPLPTCCMRLLAFINCSPSFCMPATISFFNRRANNRVGRRALRHSLKHRLGDYLAFRAVLFSARQRPLLTLPLLHTATPRHHYRVFLRVAFHLPPQTNAAFVQLSTANMPAPSSPRYAVPACARVTGSTRHIVNVTPAVVAAEGHDANRASFMVLWTFSPAGADRTALGSRGRG